MTLIRKIFMIFLTASLLLLPAAPAWPTAQIPEKILYEGESGSLFTNPLESYFTKDNPRPEFAAPHTACWRGYIGSWEIREGALYLVGINAWMRDGGGRAAPVGFEAVFPGKKAPLKAEWFTGTLRIPRGKPIRYVHMGYQTVYEEEVLLRIEKGNVVDRQRIDNRNRVQPKPPDATIQDP
jgi:hypothetical protein